MPLDPSVPAWMEELVPAEAIADPERPVSLERLLERIVPEAEPTEGRRRALARGTAWSVGLLGLAALWRLGPLEGAASPERLVAIAAPLGDSLGGALVAALAVAAAGTLMIPLTALVAACGLLFGPLAGFAAAYLGALGGAAAGYGAGRLLWRDTVRRLAGARLNALSRALARRGVVAVALVRLVPIAPFGMVNLVAGASHLRLGDFLLGSALALAPGTLALTLLADRVARAVADPGWRSIATAAAVALVAGLGLRALRQRLERAQAVRPAGSA